MDSILVVIYSLYENARSISNLVQLSEDCIGKRGVTFLNLYVIAHIDLRKEYVRTYRERVFELVQKKFTYSLISNTELIDYIEVKNITKDASIEEIDTERNRYERKWLDDLYNIYNQLLPPNELMEVVKFKKIYEEIKTMPRNQIDSYHDSVFSSDNRDPIPLDRMYDMLPSIAQKTQENNNNKKNEPINQ